MTTPSTPSPKLLTVKTWGYRFCSAIARWVCRHYCRLHIEGYQNVPPTGRAILVSNHQSYLDILVIGGIAERHVCFMARQSLAQSWWMAWVLGTCGAVLVDPKTSTRTIREAVAHLRQEDLVAIFPEGTRTTTGKIGQFERGYLSIARQAQAPIIPVGISGAYQAWPRGQKLPGRGQLAIRFGPAIDHQDPDLEEKVRSAVRQLAGE